MLSDPMMMEASLQSGGNRLAGIPNSQGHVSEIGYKAWANVTDNEESENLEEEEYLSNKDLEQPQVQHKDSQMPTTNACSPIPMDENGFKGPTSTLHGSGSSRVTRDDVGTFEVSFNEMETVNATLSGERHKEASFSQVRPRRERSNRTQVTKLDLGKNGGRKNKNVSK
ncbi:hypothetical protein NE237_017713 [Protea cynaroides]|uniref:Uncharacterized protein n=1 Tax=Protea cynaroides TaxID=273540 RepID=A0A9Q0QNH3_9MAGN|nr:hypothetical protein NE237_017713 [Protea cynaroides]